MTWAWQMKTYENSSQGQRSNVTNFQSLLAFLMGHIPTMLHRFPTSSFRDTQTTPKTIPARCTSTSGSPFFPLISWVQCLKIDIIPCHVHRFNVSLSNARSISISFFNRNPEKCPLCSSGVFHVLHMTKPMQPPYPESIFKFPTQ